MPINKKKLFSELLNKFLEINKDTEAIIISDEEGFIIAGEKRKDIDLELISFLTAVVSPILERIRTEFSFKKLGTASFDTDEHRLLFISIDENRTVSLVLGAMANIDSLAPYAYFLAEKIAQIIIAVDEDIIQLTFPNFEFKGGLSENSVRLKNQMYPSKLDDISEYGFKFIIIGDHEVGKTSIVRRFVTNTFLDDYRTTIGLDIMYYNFEAFGSKFNLTIWDVGAQKYFKRYRKTYYRGAQAAFIVFDLTSKESFENVKYWHNELKEFIVNKDIPIVIVGNKSDLTEQRMNSYQDSIRLVNELGDLSKITDLSNSLEGREIKISYIETSALIGENVKDAFNLISYHFMIKSKEREEKKMKDRIMSEMNSILVDKGSLTLSFINKDPLWSPGLQILTEIKKLGEFKIIVDKIKEKIYQYPNGLVLKNYGYKSFKVTDSDGVYCVFDARKSEYIDPEWKNIVMQIIKNIQTNRVVLIGIRVPEEIDWLKLIEEFDISISEEAENKMISLLFFKIREDYRFDIFNQFDVMLDTISNLIFNY